MKTFFLAVESYFQAFEPTCSTSALVFVRGVPTQEQTAHFFLHHKLQADRLDKYAAAADLDSSNSARRDPAASLLI